MCRLDTVRLRWPAAAIFAAALTLYAQTNPDWRKIGGSSVELNLAAPVTGEVDAVWFAPEGDRLYARLHSGRIFETQDFETWTPAAAAPPHPDAPVGVAIERSPEPSVRLQANALDPQRVYALGSHLYESDDGGRTWTNLTGYNNQSVIGGAQHDIAVSPRDSKQIAVANDLGVWRSLDGGLSWSGLNAGLPNLQVRQILSTPKSSSPIRIALDSSEVLELPSGVSSARRPWTSASDSSLQALDALRQRISGQVGVRITAVASAGDTIYAGAVDGRLWVSSDRGITWLQSSSVAGGAVERIFLDSEAPRLALAVSAASGAGRILRTTNTGLFWDDVTGNLPEGAAHSVTADRAAGAAYVATDRGVFFGRMDLNQAGPASPVWIPITRQLPEAKAFDVKLDAGGNQLYVALDGYGIYAAAAPHRARTLRLVNAADLSARPAAPGSLLSELGAKIVSARAAELQFPVLAASESGSQIQVPFEAAGPTVSLSLEADSKTSVFGLQVRNVSPAIFIDPDGAPILVDADTGMALDARNTARSHSRIQLMATGLGRVRPNWPTGLAAPLENTPAVVANVQVFLDGAPLEVTKATLAPNYIGLYLVEFQLPALVNSGPAELYMTAEGQESNRVRMYLEATN